MRDTNLINALREHAEWARANEWETPITLGDDLAEAADVIEKLSGQLKACEDTGLTPEEIDMDHEAAEQLRHLCRNCDLDRLEKLAEADKEGRLFLLPLEPGRPMLCQEHFERTWVMKNVAPCVQYQSSVGVVFHMEYDVFRGLVERGKITPLSPEGEKALEVMKDG